MIFNNLFFNIRANHIRNKKVAYPTAKPGKSHYRKAGERFTNIYQDGQRRRMSQRRRRELIDIFAYFERYNHIRIREGMECCSETSRILATAPWMANRNSKHYVPVLKELFQNDILVFDPGKNCVYLDDIGYQKAKLVKVESGGYNFKELYNYMIKEFSEDPKQFLTLKMSVFHARSFMPPNENLLLDLMHRFPNLSIQALCVGKPSGIVAKEGADDKHMKEAIKTGMMKMYKVAFWHRRQFKVRMIRKDIADASLRCWIVMKGNEISYFECAVFRVGKERGLSGNSIYADKESSLAIQINRIFDDAFKRGVPAHKNFEWFLYLFRRFCGFGIKVALVILIVSCFEPFKPGKSGDPFDPVTCASVILTILFEKALSFFKMKLFAEET